MTDTSVDPQLFSRNPAERRAFRDEIGRGIGRYIPPELRPLLGFVADATPSAALERAGSASMEAVAPDRTVSERIGSVGRALSETAGVAAPMVAAPRAAIPASEALQEALLGASVGARTAGQGFMERMNRPGEVPVMYSGFDPEAIIRALREGAQQADVVRFYEDQIAGGVAAGVARERAINRFGIDPVSGTAARGPENFAQGGAVMMRSGMPEQIHQGLGSLSEVPRRMFMGGEVFSSMGNPLAPYEQYLTQTYAEPIQQSAQQAVGQFVNSVKQKEQAYFGGGGMGGGMGSPMQGGLMGSPMQSPMQSPMPAELTAPGTPAQMSASPFGDTGLGMRDDFAQQRMASFASTLPPPAPQMREEDMTPEQRLSFFQNNPEYTQVGQGSFQHNTLGYMRTLPGFSSGAGIV